MNLWEFMSAHPILTVILALIVGEMVNDISKAFRNK